MSFSDLHLINDDSWSPERLALPLRSPQPRNNPLTQPSMFLLRHGREDRNDSLFEHTG